MERGIVLLMLIVFCVFLIADSVSGNKKYLDKFIEKTIPSWDFPKFSLIGGG